MVIIRNLTPHTVTLLDLVNRPLATIPAIGSVARLREISSEPQAVETQFGSVLVQHVAYADQVTDLPDPTDGVRYLVSRVTAAARPYRTDLVFPQGEVRDAEGRIIGCRALGTFNSAGLGHA